MSLRRRPGLALAGAAVAIAAIVAAGLILRGPEPQALDAHTSYDELATNREGGETIADGSIYMLNRSDKPIELESAKVIAVGPNVPTDFRFLVAGLDGTTGAQGGAELRCPPTFFSRARMKPLPGFVLPPASTPTGKRGAVLITCFTVPPAPSRFRITKTSITYRQDGERRTLTFPNSFALCAARGGKCDPDPKAWTVGMGGSASGAAIRRARAVPGRVRSPARGAVSPSVEQRDETGDAVAGAGAGEADDRPALAEPAGRLPIDDGRVEHRAVDDDVDAAEDGRRLAEEALHV